jgi:hypothetical protein
MGLALVALGGGPTLPGVASLADGGMGRPPTDPSGMAAHIWAEFQVATPHGQYWGPHNDTKRKLVARWAGKVAKKIETTKDQPLPTCSEDQDYVRGDLV